MIYRKNEDVIEKYKVTIDKEEVKKLRIEIINNCSYIIHREYQTTIPYRYGNNPLKYRNFSSKELGWREFRDGPDEMEYLVKFDEYEFPKVVGLIDELLKGNETVLDKLFDTKEEKIDLDKMIKEKSEELDKIENTDIKNKRKVLNELSELVDKKNLNKNQKSEEYYIEKLKNYIHYELVDTIDLELVNKVDEFYGRTLKK